MIRYGVYAILGSVIILAFYNLLFSDHPGFLINLPGLVVVLGGTVLTTILSQSTSKVQALFRNLPTIVRESPVDGREDCETLLQIADWYRRGNVRVADRMVESIHQPLLRYGIELILDRNEKNDISRLLKWRIGALRDADLGEIQIVRTMATFAPAFGMLGTLFGLVKMLYGLGDSGLSEIGLTMGFAMTTTVYGLIVANLIFKPLAIRMERRAKRNLVWLNVQYEAILMVYDRRHPIVIHEYIDAFLGKTEGESSGMHEHAAEPG